MIQNQRQPYEKTRLGYDGSKSPKSTYDIGARRFVDVLKESTSRKGHNFEENMSSYWRTGIADYGRIHFTRYKTIFLGKILFL